MIEVLVWLLISHGANGASHTVAQFKTEQSCMAIKSQVDRPLSKANCIQANIYIKKD